ncbi:MAG: 3-hydroxybutyryl-CoA dehydrogenase [Alphaproteobacteria bacterium]|nr:3-hydroxybutyryl-CoA dehydrogenase [Alphaproteobacteria bacterium]
MAEPVEIRKIGIVGAGQMGSGIAQVCAQTGYAVSLADISEEFLEKAVTGISSRLQRLVDKERLTQDDLDTAISNIATTTDYVAFGDCDLVIEAATENEEIKKAIFEKLIPALREDATLATNTSSISITRLAAATDRPELFIGMHFMNPVPVMKLVELIKGIATDDATYNAVNDVVAKLGKTSITSEDFPAFIVNRILVPMMNEAIYVLQEGVGGVTDIDGAMKLGANQPMGPLELADFVGLDTCLAIMQVLYDGFADSKYRPCPLLVKYVEAGWLGRKSGRGFYDYTGDKPVPTR